MQCAIRNPMGAFWRAPDGREAPAALLEDWQRRLGLRFDERVVLSRCIDGPVQRLTTQATRRESVSKRGRGSQPTFPAAFSKNKEPSRMYLRSVARLRWPVCAMMARSLTPAAAAAVAMPERRLWPARSAGVSPAAAAQRFTIRATALSESRAARRCDRGGRCAAGTVPRSSPTRRPSPAPPAHGARLRVRAVGDADAPSLPFLVGLRAAHRHDQAFLPKREFRMVEPHKFRAPEGAGEADQQQRAVADALERVGQPLNLPPEVLGDEGLFAVLGGFLGAAEPAITVRTMASVVGDAKPASC
jgi:hypothetical protein